MKAINNDYLVNGLYGGCSCALFAPSVSFAVGVNSVIFTQASTFDAGDSLLRLRCEIYDKNGVMKSQIMSGAGSGVTFGTATVGGGAVLTAPVTAGGTGYTAPPTIVFTGGGGTGAVGVATVVGGVITGVTIVNGGTGYTTAPTVTAVLTSCEIPLTGLDTNYELTFKAFIVSAGGCKADLQNANMKIALNTSGTLGSINEQGDNNADGNNI